MVRLLFKLNSIGISLVELILSLGLTSLVALSTGTIMFESFKTSKEASNKEQVQSLAKEIQYELKSASMQRLQYEGKNANGDEISTQKINCGGVINLSNQNWDEAVKEMRTSEGTKIEVTLHSSGGLKLKSGEETNRSGLGIREIKLANAQIISRDRDLFMTVSADIYVDTDSRIAASHFYSVLQKPPTYVGRIVLTRDLKENNFSECHVPELIGDTAVICDSSAGFEYNLDNPAYPRCVDKRNKTESSPITLCAAGFYGVTDGSSNAACNANNAGCRDPHDKAVALVDGYLKCARMVGYDSKPTPPITPLDEDTSVSKSCQNYITAYGNCVEKNPATPQVCGEPPSINNCEDIASVPLKRSTASVAPSINTEQSKCLCGNLKTAIPEKSYCYTCSIGVSRGYEYGTTITPKFKLFYCWKGGLLLSAEGNAIRTSSNVQAIVFKNIVESDIPPEGANAITCGP